MKREEILKEYSVNAVGLITNPGKFEGEPLYAPYFWDAFLNGCWDDELDGGTLVYNIIADDIKEFPELKGAKQVWLSCDDNGFVYCETIGGALPGGIDVLTGEFLE